MCKFYSTDSLIEFYTSHCCVFPCAMPRPKVYSRSHYNPFQPATALLHHHKTANSNNNAELIQENQRLLLKVQKLSLISQTMEGQNFALRERCVKLQNRVDELTDHLAFLKEHVHAKINPIKEIASHLNSLADFMKCVDESIEIEGGTSDRIDIEGAPEVVRNLIEHGTPVKTTSVTSDNDIKSGVVIDF